MEKMYKNLTIDGLGIIIIFHSLESAIVSNYLIKMVFFFNFNKNIYKEKKEKD